MNTFNPKKRAILQRYKYVGSYMEKKKKEKKELIAHLIYIGGGTIYLNWN